MENISYYLNKISLLLKTPISDVEGEQKFFHVEHTDEDKKMLDLAQHKPISEISLPLTFPYKNTSLTSKKAEMYLKIDNKLYGFNRRQYYYLFYRTISYLNFINPKYPDLFQTAYSYAFSLIPTKQTFNKNCSRFKVHITQGINILGKPEYGFISTENNNNKVDRTSNIINLGTDNSYMKKRLGDEILSQIHSAMAKCDIIGIDITLTEHWRSDFSTTGHNNFIILKKDKNSVWHIYPYEPHGFKLLDESVSLFIKDLKEYCENPAIYMGDPEYKDRLTGDPKPKYKMIFDILYHSAFCSYPHGMQILSNDPVGFCVANSLFMFFMFVITILLDDENFNKANLKNYVTMIEKKIVSDIDSKKIIDMTFDLVEKICNYYFQNMLKYDIFLKDFKNSMIYYFTNLETPDNTDFLKPIYFRYLRPKINKKNSQQEYNLQEDYDFCLENKHCKSGFCFKNYCINQKPIDYKEPTQEDAMNFNEWFEKHINKHRNNKE